MAKLKDLAGLAALGALGYKLSQTNQGMGSGKDDNDALANANRVSRMSDDSDTLARVNSNMSPGQNAVNDTNAGVLNAISKPKMADDTSADNTTANAYKSGVMGGSKQPTAAKAKPRGMTGAQNDALAKVNKAATDARNLDYGNESNRIVQPKLGPGSVIPVGARFVPGFGMVDADGNIIPGQRNTAMQTESMRNPRTGREMTTFKRGGAVKKMASGGMTSSASKRGDGIATKGKTRGKLC
jgi:hypothetical protein